ncbi:MAG TPA: T9SS type A sorting domain-containing protein [Ignavibacteria bacterium]
MKQNSSFLLKVYIVLLLIISLGILPGIIQHNEESFTENEETSSGALESMQWISQIRAYPDKDIPQEKFYEAFEYSKNNLAQDKNLDNMEAWQSIGPNNVGGRSLCLAVHPVDTATLFMGSASGGLWKSTTGGLGASAWTLINTGYPSLAVSSIAIDSTNPNVMFIGTGENYGYQYSVNNGVNVRVTRGMYGIGILKTTNGGTTWTKSLDWSYNNQRGVWKVIINPKNPNILYAATSEGIYKSYDAGANWNQVLNYLMGMDLVLNPIDTTILIASVGNLSNNIPNSNVGIYKSTNAGTSWIKLSDGTHGLPTFWSGKTTLGIYQGNPNVIFASIANDPTNPSNSYVGLYMSTDGGNSWTQKYNNTGFMTNQGWYNNAFLIKNNNQNNVLLGNLDVYRSINGGTSFTKLSNWQGWIDGATPPGQPEGGTSTNFSHADQHYFASNPKDPNKIYSVTDGGLYRSNDFGTTFYSCNGGYVTTQFYASLGQSYTDSIFCVGGLQDNRAVFYQGTTAWYKTFVGDGFSSAVNSQNNSICYTEYGWGDINRSTDGGVSWTDIAPSNSGSEANYCFCAPYVVCRSNPNYVYIGGVTVYKSTTGSGSWQGPYGSFGGRKVLSLACSNNSTDTLYCGVIPPTIGSTLRASIFKSVNGGTVWTEIADTNVLPNRYPTDIHIDGVNANIVYVTYGGFSSGHVFKTTNGGVSWIDITGNLPDLPYHCIVTDPLYPQNIYVGNDLAVYVSANGGTSWSEFRNGMPYAIVFDLSIVNANRKLRATTHGNGIYQINLAQNPVGITRNVNETPTGFKLYQNYPNPFNPTTKIQYDIPKSGLVTLKVYDLLGKEVVSIINGNVPAGSYITEFNAGNLSSGIYFYRLTAGNFSETKKLMVIK